MKIKGGQEWSFDLIDFAFENIERIAKEKFKLDTYPNQIEIISSEQMLDAYCVAPHHKVLHNDLHWRPAGETKVNDILLGFDENGPHRAFKKAKVTHVSKEVRPVSKVLLSTGQTFIVTNDHRWLVRQQRGKTSMLLWRRTDQLRGYNDSSGYSPSRIPKVIDTWVEDTSKDAGWIAGMYDGEGNILKGSLQKLSIAQNSGLILEKLSRLFHERDILHSITKKSGSECMNVDILGPVKNKLKFLGTYRPERLISKLDFDNLGLMKTPHWEEVVSVVPAGECEIVKITTSTGTFICEGYPMHNCAVGLPLYYPHWSFGKAFVEQLEAYKRGRMGLAYEIVINSNPCISYLMEENTMLMQTLVLAHAAFGHNHFFKNNYLFNMWTDADAIIDYLVYAKNYIRECEELYGIETVEEVLDSCHALMSYGVDKYKRPSQPSAGEEKARRREREKYIQSQLNDIWRTVPKTKTKYDKESEERFPNEPQENILYFIEKNAPNLDEWKREIIRIVRKISQYFYPQGQTKLMNEGCATFFHYEIIHEMYDQGLIDDGAMLEFYESHTGVTRQLPYNHKYYSGINPYALGFELYKDIKRVSVNPTEEDREWFGDQEWVGRGDWLNTIHWAIKNFKDESFIQQFITPKVMRDFLLFVVHDDERDPKLQVTEIHNRQGYKNIREKLAKQYSNDFIIPDIQVYNVDRWGDRSMTLHHYMVNKRPLHIDDTIEVLKHISFLWGYDVQLISKDTTGSIQSVYNSKNGEDILDIFIDDD